VNDVHTDTSITCNPCYKNESVNDAYKCDVNAFVDVNGVIFIQCIKKFIRGI
jgi:hypothetical protein